MRNETGKIGPYDLNTIVTGDARELAEAIPDESVDLVFTDPVYDRIDDYRWLAETAARVLRPDRFCLIYYGVGYLPETAAAMSEFLTYEWAHVSYMPTINRRGAYKTFSNYSGFLRYMKGRAIPQKHIRDLYVSTYRSSNSGHKWTKHAGLIGHHIMALAPPMGAVIFDPFTGSGTVPAVCKMLQRDYIAFEIDPDTAAMARQRVAETQPPLPIVMAEQQGFDLE